MGFQSAGIGRLCSWDRSSAGGLAVLFAGVGFSYGTAGAMATEIDIPFAGVQVQCGAASGVASEVWVQSAGVGPTFCVTGYNQYKWGAVLFLRHHHVFQGLCWCSFRFGNHPLPF